MNPAELNLNPLSQIDPVVIVVVALIVMVTYLLLKRVYVQPYLEVMESREELFSSARRLSAEAANVTRESELLAEAVLCEAAATAEDLRSTAQARADAYRKDRLAELQAARVRELASVQTQAIECVAAACEQLLGGADSETVESTVVRLMERKAD
jgi:F0F1-type ATP synthase membrane subunit b/b'